MMLHPNERPHYRNGTSAGMKGGSALTRANGRQAADKVNETLAPRHRQMLDAWEGFGAAGAIPEQIAAMLGLPVHLVRPRAGELVKRGLLFEIGRRPGGLGCAVTAYSTVRPEAREVAA